MRFKVFSGYTADLESGFQPHLEAAFKTKEDADTYVQTWRALYPTGEPDFWVSS